MGGNDDNKQDRKSLDLILWLVWFSLMFSQAIFGLSALLIPAPDGFTVPDIAAGQPPKILVILGVATVALVPILINVRKKMFFEPLGDKCYPGSAEAQSAYFTMSLTTWIFCELIGVFGLVLTYMTYRVAYALPFVLVSLALMLAFRPSAPQQEPRS